MMFDGYLNRAEATAEVLSADGWYHTGDVAVLDGDGMPRIVGRESVDLIKSGDTGWGPARSRPRCWATRGRGGGGGGAAR